MGSCICCARRARNDDDVDYDNGEPNEDPADDIASGGPGDDVTPRHTGTGRHRTFGSGYGYDPEYDQ